MDSLLSIRAISIYFMWYTQIFLPQILYVFVWFFWYSYKLSHLFHLYIAQSYGTSVLCIEVLVNHFLYFIYLVALLKCTRLEIAWLTNNLYPIELLAEIRWE